MLDNDVFEEFFVDLNHSVPKLSHRVLLTLTRGFGYSTLFAKRLIAPSILCLLAYFNA